MKFIYKPKGNIAAFLTYMNNGDSVSNDWPIYMGSEMPHEATF